MEVPLRAGLEEKQEVTVQLSRKLGYSWGGGLPLAPSTRLGYRWGSATYNVW